MCTTPSPASCWPVTTMHAACALPIWCPGHVLDQVLSQEVTAVQGLLKCRPFVMRVIDQKNGRLYLDAGTDTRIQPGDVVTVYQSEPSGSVFGAAGRMEQFGSPRAPIRVVQVFPGYAVAEPERTGQGAGFVPGEYLRAW
jgi:hypothetical protein